MLTSSRGGGGGWYWTAAAASTLPEPYRSARPRRRSGARPRRTRRRPCFPCPGRAPRYHPRTRRSTRPVVGTPGLNSTMMRFHRGTCNPSALRQKRRRSRHRAATAARRSSTSSACGGRRPLQRTRCDANRGRAGTGSPATSLDADDPGVWPPAPRVNPAVGGRAPGRGWHGKDFPCSFRPSYRPRRDLPPGRGMCSNPMAARVDVNP